MIDAWEVMGRLLTDDVFRAAVFAAAPTTRPSVNQATRATYRMDAFTSLNTAIRTVITDRPLSLMGLGEILWPLGSDDFRKKLTIAAQVVIQTGINMNRVNYYFYAALGAMMVDGQLRQNLKSSSPYSPFDTWGWGQLALADRQALVGLFDWTPAGAGVVPTPPFELACENVCRVNWTEDCFLKTIDLTYDSGDHTHPVPWLTPTAAPSK
jgi:hypothetical protein